MKVIYFVRFNEEFKTIPEAIKASKGKGIFYPNESFRVGYRIPQPKYKSWVPNWFIKYLIKHQKPNN